MKTLYKKNNLGRIEQWSISYGTKDSTGFIKINFGKFEGKIQEKIEWIEQGKNFGKKNETSIEEQTKLEAQARFKKQLKKGYVDSIEKAQANKTDEIIKGGILPMLAHKFEEYKYSLEFPILVQPKLDGQRCIATKQNGVVTLWTRTRKPILSVPQVIEQLDELLRGCDNIFIDGELYSHEKNNFEKIMSAVRKQKCSPESRKIQYHVYDCEFLNSQTQTFKDRIKFLMAMKLKSKNVVTVRTFSCPTLQSVEDMQKLFIDQGYEGLMLRQSFGTYQCKRSPFLLKMKTFDDAEFEILDFVKGNDQSVVAICKRNNIDNKTFGATMSGNKTDNQKFLLHKELYIGKNLTVKYQGLSGYGVPRFPIGLRIRGEE